MDRSRIESDPTIASKMKQQYLKHFNKTSSVFLLDKARPTSCFMDLSQQFTIPYSDGFNKCLNDRNNYFRLLRANETGTSILSEALIRTYPTKYLLKTLSTFFKENLPKELLALREKDIIEGGQDKKLLELVEMRDFLGDVAQMTTFKIPIYRSDEKFQEKFIKGLSDAAFRFGYGLAQEEKLQTDFQPFEERIDVLQLSFEAKYADFEFKFSNYFYHVTTASRLKRILMFGLVPSSQHHIFKYPDRVYLYNNETVQTMIWHGIDKLEFLGEDYLALLRIESEPFLKSKNYFNGNPRMYIDSRIQSIDNTEPRAIFTYQKIDRQFIDDHAVLFGVRNGIPFKVKDINLKTDDLSEYNML